MRQVTSSTNNAQRGLEDYNPFEDQRPPAVSICLTPVFCIYLYKFSLFLFLAQNMIAGGGAGGATMFRPPTAQSAIMQPSQEATPPPSYNRSAQQTQMTTAEFQVCDGYYLIGLLKSFN